MVSPVRAISEDEIAVYREYGVAKLSGLVALDLVEEMRVALDEHVANPGQWVTDAGFRSQRCFGLGDPLLRGYLLDPVLGENAARAMGSPTANFFFDHMFLFEPDTPIDGHYWHQDLPFWPVDGDHVVSVWLSLYDCEPESAALKFVPGSHRERRFYRPLGFDGSPMTGDLGDRAELAIDARSQFFDHAAPAFHEDPETHGVREFSYLAGDAVIFNTRTVHSSGGNNSPDQRRLAYSARFIGDDARMMLRQGVFQDPALLPDPDEHFAVGAPMRSRRWPRVYPMTSGDE